MLIKAIQFAATAHKGQVRKGSKLPYITHPFIVSTLLSRYKTSVRHEELQCACILHDTLEDTPTTFVELANEFTPLVATLVQELTSCDDEIKKLGKNEYLKKKLLSLTPYGLTIKLVDRLSNVMDMPSEKYLSDTVELLNYLATNRKLNNTQRTICDDIYSEVSIALLKLRDVK